MVVPGPAIARAGGVSTTVMLAEAVAPVPPSREVTALVVFVCTPSVVPVTVTLNVPLPPAANVPPDKVIVFEPGTATIVPPPKLPINPLGVAITSPTGSVSVNPMPLSEVDPFGLEIVKRRPVEPSSPIEVAPNDWPIVGGTGTKMVANAEGPSPPSL